MPAVAPQMKRSRPPSGKGSLYGMEYHSRTAPAHSTAWRRWVAALLTISKKLEKLDKTKGKGKGAKPLTATTRTTPRESGAETEDNRPDPSNFGRDTFPGFDA